MTKLVLGSPEWLEAYRTIIRNAAAGQDLSTSAFGMHETLKNVPAHLRQGGDADLLFGFRIVDGQLQFPDRAWEDADFKLVADFESIAPWGDLPTKETRELGVFERLAKAGKLRFSGSLSGAPEWLHKLNLHDRLAEITAPYEASPSWDG
ncbi:hypothetical protein [Sphingosinicella rhizophila]|uniref:Uncharacterized protein n=1 Tax=Sphingosinicella rhizophila TaxID=3050082 RepID=A0ABU3Q6W3_9SPHN|nr:hypothetical protein [Sphingosinicella sp. GR2756]MDT9598723.1 hypothetical protein [Sphingosinicella sp. GR2756]